ncbi:MAG: molybdate ABC transporter substrate-binding protein [Bacteroidota bacterium]
MLKESQIIVFAIAFILSLVSCNSNKTETLRIAAASNLRYALEELNAEFEKGTNIKVEMSAASSGKLTAQIQNGAPFDIFLSANKKYPDYLFENGFGLEKPKLFCSGLIVYWTNKGINLKGDIYEIADEKIKKIAIANPQNAPFGQASVQVLKSIGIYDSVKQKVIFAENVSQISQYVLNNNVDVGFSSKSLVLSPKLKGKGKWFDVDESLYKPIEQFVLLLKGKRQNKNAKNYYEFLFSQNAQKILKEYGYKTIE